MVELRRPVKKEVLVWAKKNWDKPEKEIELAYLKADGWPAILRELLENPAAEINQQIIWAKEFLAKNNPAGRLAYLAQKGQEANFNSGQLLTGLCLASRAALASLAAAKESPQKMIREWQERLLVFNQLRTDWLAKSSKAAVELKLGLLNLDR